jgi:TPR repeat protein
LDYRGMARALSVAANAELRAGNTRAAAELYMRAGQGAAAQGDAESARPWLRRAADVGRPSKTQCRIC